MAQDDLGPYTEVNVDNEITKSRRIILDSRSYPEVMFSNSPVEFTIKPHIDYAEKLKADKKTLADDLYSDDCSKASLELMFDEGVNWARNNLVLDNNTHNNSGWHKTIVDENTIDLPDKKNGHPYNIILKGKDTVTTGRYYDNIWLVEGLTYNIKDVEYWIELPDMPVVCENKN